MPRRALAPPRAMGDAARMSFLRFLGIGGEGEPARRAAAPEPREAETIRRIAGELEKLDPDEARYLAAFAYVLARLAHADLHIDESETEQMQRVIEETGRLEPAEAALVVEIAKSQARLLGGTENYIVTREFRRISSPEQRAGLLECLYAVAAADGSISTIESSELTAIAEELGFSRAEANAVRSKYREHLAVLRGREG